MISKKVNRNWLFIFTLIFLCAASFTVSAAVIAPTNMSCQGWEIDSINLSWEDTQADVTEYRVQKNIDGAGWNNIATLPTTDRFYSDVSIDVAKNNQYRIEAFSGVDGSTAASLVCNNRRVYETANFRIFYGLRGKDDCPPVDGNDSCLADLNAGADNRYVKLAGDIMEGSLDSFIRVGFAAGKGSAPPAGLDKIPVNIIWCDGGGCAGGSSFSMSPTFLETAFDPMTRVGDPIAYIVSLHELFHFLQFAHPGLVDPSWQWVFEGQARTIQDKLCIGADRATCNHFDDIPGGAAGYVPEIGVYMVNTHKAINQSSYQAVLFWAYMIEKFGTTPVGDAVEGNMNFMVEFWESVEANPGSDGITALNIALQELGSTQTFTEIWKDFSVANYAKNLSGPSVPAKYQYSDMQEAAGGAYPSVKFQIDQNITLGDQLVGSSESVQQWGARYYRLKPDATVTDIDIKITQDSTSTMYYTVLGVTAGDITFEKNEQGRNLDLLLTNNAYDEVVVIVTALNTLSNYRYSFNGVDPILNIVKPIFGSSASVGDPAAPEKFLLAVELLDGNGSPLASVDLNNFTFTVGSVPIPSTDIITSAQVQGQQWFVLRAPVQMSAGFKDLTVNYGASLSTTQLSALNYVVRTNVDSVITLDRSGSMSNSNKLSSAVDAAKLYVDSWRVGDKIGLTSFSDSPAGELALSNWSDSPAGGTRQTIFNLVDGFTASGGTALGDSVKFSWDELTNSGDASHDWAIVLLSDGLQTAGTETLATVTTQLGNVAGAKPVIHTVAIGPDADQMAMQAIATATGGSYQYVSAPSDTASSSASPATPPGEGGLQLQFDKRYRVVSSKLDQTQQVFSQDGPLNDGDLERDEVIIPIEDNASELVISLSFINSTDANITLFDSTNNVVAPYQSTSRYRVWRVASPMSGDWRLVMAKPVYIPPILTQKWWYKGIDWIISSANAQTVVEYLPNYLIQANLRSEVRMDAFVPLALTSRISAAQIPILVSLTDTAAITGANISMDIWSPDGQVTSQVLLDDGKHEDGAANDGIYGSIYASTQKEGSYIVNIHANGVSPLNGSFLREESLAFFILGGPDLDNDNLPDVWEDAHGLDTSNDDSVEDPDGDGLTNGEEWLKGTHPNDPDSDNGGEADGTDVNPLDPSDDRLLNTWVIAYPDNNRISAFYTLRPNYQRVEIIRASSIDGPYTVVGDLYPGEGVFIDTNVTNNTVYCYMAIGYDASNNQSAPINPYCTTPKEDAFAPHGSIAINGNQPLTVIPEVTLSLWATDKVDPESVTPNEEIYLPSIPPNSGVTEMMISNSADFSGAIWEAYTTTKAWNLVITEGLATVYVKYRDAYQNESEIAVDSIQVVILDLTACVVNPIGVATQFNYFISGNGTQLGSQIQGRVAIGGNAVLTNHNTGNALKPNQMDQNTIIVGNNLSFTQGTVTNGDVVYGGEATLNNIWINNGNASMGYPINFGVEANNQLLLSQVWSTIGATGASVVQYWGGPSAQITLSGNNPTLNVFNLSSSDLGAANTLTINAPSGSTALINVEGETISMKSFGINTNGIDAQKIIYNFYEATTMDIRYIEVKGTILAPKANLTFVYGAIRGTAIANSVNGTGTQAINQLFDGCMPVPSL